MELINLLLTMSLQTHSFVMQPSIAEMITHEAKREGLDPKLVLSIAKVESNLNPNAVGALNEQGLFQLRPEYHKVKPGDTWNNIRVGVKYLAELKAFCSYYPDDSWINCFNRGQYRFKLKYPKKFSYYVKVMEVKSCLDN